LRRARCDERRTDAREWRQGARAPVGTNALEARARSCQNVVISRISMLVNIGTSLAISTARASDSASMNDQPPTISFPSTYGPSVTAPFLYTADAPPGLGPERAGGCSRISLAYLAIQDFHFMYPACISAGEG